MSIPSLTTLSVVLDPASRESGLGVRFADAARDLWRQRRLARHVARAFEPASARRSGAGAMPPAMRPPQSWTGDIARPGR